MERIITHDSTLNVHNAASFDEAVVQFENEVKPEELSCSLLLKNLLKTNLRLSKLNELTNVILF